MLWSKIYFGKIFTRLLPKNKSPKNVIIVYDGDCPFCSSFVRLYKLREKVDSLEIINARQNSLEIIKEIKKRGFDLDAGFVVKVDDRFYHASQAINILALIGSNEGIFNCLNILIFRFENVAKILYPPMRLLRNFTLWIRGKTKINDN